MWLFELWLSVPNHTPFSFFSFISFTLREREFKLNGEVMFTASFVEPECKKMLQDALAAKRVTWPLLMNSCFIFKLTQATMPIENLRIVVRHLVQEDVKQNASAKCDNIIEHFFRVRGLPGQKEYDPVFARLLKKHKLVLPLTCDGRLACLWFDFVCFEIDTYSSHFLFSCMILRT